MQSLLLLTAVTSLLLAPSLAGPCSDHGSLACKCDYGYTGQDCDVPIDWCAQANPDFAGGRNNSAFCGHHGHCVSTPEDGAHCICLPGFTGPFCETPIPGKVTISRRCILYETPTTRRLNTTSLCPKNLRCLTDRLNCAFPPDPSNCKNPIGWCLPMPAADAVMKAYIARQTAAKVPSNGPSGPHLFLALSGSVKASAQRCVHGTGTCTCDTGYTGAKCGQEIDFCNLISPILAANRPMGSVCGPHGHCQSSPAGLSCRCDQGWSGDFCDIPNPRSVTESRRCVPYQTDTSKRLNETILCPSGQRCLSDRLNCGFQGCVYPIGWCLPAPQLDSYTHTRRR